MRRIFLFLILGCASLLAGPLINSYRFAAPAAGVEGFEGTGAPTNWTDLAIGGQLVNWDYTASPLAGAQSLFLADSTADGRIALYDLPPMPTRSGLHSSFGCRHFLRLTPKPL